MVVVVDEPQPVVAAVLYDQIFHFVISIVHRIYEGHNLHPVDLLSFDVCQLMPVIQHSSCNSSIYS